jgi:uncharacterized protein with HEPN domain
MRSNQTQQRLQHVLNSIMEIENYFKSISTYEDFKNNSLVLFASIKQLEIIGEAVNHINTEVLLQQNHIPWNKIIGMRNMLVHEYFGVNPEVIFTVIKFDLPPLKIAIENLISAN